MTPQQLTAISNECEFAEQCADQKYRRIIRKGASMLSIILTLNVGEE